MVVLDDWGPDRMMDRSYGGGMMDGSGWVVMLLGLLVVVVVVAVAAYAVVTASRPRTPPGPTSPSTAPSSRDVLDLRLARGEITPEEYGERRQLLDH